MRKIFGFAISYPFVENMLCEIWRDRAERNVAVREYYYLHKHRTNYFHGQQNLVRFKYESGLTMSIKLLPFLKSRASAEQDTNDYVGKIEIVFEGLEVMFNPVGGSRIMFSFWYMKVGFQISILLHLPMETKCILNDQSLRTKKFTCNF